MSSSVFFAPGDTPRLHSEQPQSSDDHSKIVLEYLNEGGANFVFRILPGDDDAQIPSNLQGHLLRLRKDLPHVPSAKEQLSAFDDYFKPLFPPESVVQQRTIDLHHDLPASINAALSQINRPSHRLQDFLADGETHGLLVTDMTPRKGELLLQVKPKWLEQSPTAPRDSKRCRTCALRAQRASKKVRTATDAQASCPLSLISNVSTERGSAAKVVADHPRFQKYLMDDAQPLLRTLRDNQRKLDNKGALHATTPDEILDLCKAMTIRDCTLFLKLTGDSIEARLADLDLKQPEKVEQWRKVEASLIEQGWYTNAEDKTHWEDEKVCLLSRQ